MNLMRRDSSRFGTGKLLKGDDAEVFAKVSFLTLDEVYRIESLLEKLDADNSGTSTAGSRRPWETHSC